MLFGLGSTQSLSLPMLTVLRRLSILLTMVAEHLFLGVQVKTEVKLSVYLMIFGAAVAASNDLAFDLAGYFYIMMNNVSTAANGVYMKKKLDAKSLGWLPSFWHGFITTLRESLTAYLSFFDSLTLWFDH